MYTFLYAMPVLWYMCALKGTIAPVHANTRTHMRAGANAHTHKHNNIHHHPSLHPDGQHQVRNRYWWSYRYWSSKRKIFIEKVTAMSARSSITYPVVRCHVRDGFPSLSVNQSVRTGKCESCMALKARYWRSAYTAEILLYLNAIPASRITGYRLVLFILV